MLPWVTCELIDDRHSWFLILIFLLFGLRFLLISVKHHTRLNLHHLLLASFVLFHMILVLSSFLQFFGKTIVDNHLLRLLLDKIELNLRFITIRSHFWILSVHFFGHVSLRILVFFEITWLS
jgi:hypothetical protein